MYDSNEGDICCFFGLSSCSEVGIIWRLNFEEDLDDQREKLNRVFHPMCSLLLPWEPFSLPKIFKGCLWLSPPRFPCWQCSVSCPQECPKCHVTIEKDGGCNHMVCRNQNCKAEFCWVCLGPWEPHGSAWWVQKRGGKARQPRENLHRVLNWTLWHRCPRYRYNCNRYNEDDAKAARDAQEVSP